ncbi:hypothetical protein [Streptomyces hypolithicus]
MIGDHGIGGDDHRRPLLVGPGQDEPGADGGCEPFAQVEETALAVYVGMGDQRQLVLVTSQIPRHFRDQPRPPGKQRLRSPGGREHHQPPPAGAERGPVPVAVGQGRQHPVERRIADHSGTTGGRRALGVEPRHLGGVRERVQTGEQPTVPLQIRPVEPGRRIARTLSADRLVEPGPVRQQHARSATQQMKVILGSAGEDQVMRTGDGLGPGDPPGAGTLDGGEGIDPEVGPGHEGETPYDSGVPGEDGQYVEQPMQGGGRPHRERHGRLPPYALPAFGCPLPAARCPLGER